jgi:hypothetical protein
MGKAVFIFLVEKSAFKMRTALNELLNEIFYAVATEF